MDGLVFIIKLILVILRISKNLALFLLLLVGLSLLTGILGDADLHLISLVKTVFVRLVRKKLVVFRLNQPLILSRNHLRFALFRKSIVLTISIKNVPSLLPSSVGFQVVTKTSLLRLLRLRRSGYILLRVLIYFRYFLLLACVGRQLFLYLALSQLGLQGLNFGLVFSQLN
jgi:hypothetical protein